MLDCGSSPAVVSASVHTATVPESRNPDLDQQVRVHSNIGLRSTLRQELLIDLPVPQFDSDFLGRTQPIIADDRFALRRSADPARDQLTVVRVSVHILKVVIKASVASWKIDRNGESSLQPQIEPRDLGQRVQNRARPAMRPSRAVLRGITSSSLNPSPYKVSQLRSFGIR